jgi:hypothetical protein
MFRVYVIAPFDDVANGSLGFVHSLLKLASMFSVSQFQITANGAHAKKLRIGLALSWRFFLQVSFCSEIVELN